MAVLAQHALHKQDLCVAMWRRQGLDVPMPPRTDCCAQVRVTYKWKLVNADVQTWCFDHLTNNSPLDTFKACQEKVKLPLSFIAMSLHLGPECKHAKHLGPKYTNT
jgi:hypothetical protein